MAAVLAFVVTLKGDAIHVWHEITNGNRCILLLLPRRATESNGQFLSIQFTSGGGRLLITMTEKKATWLPAAL